VLVEAYNNVRLVEQYYALLQRAYSLLTDELKAKNINKDLILQMAIKAVNNLAGLDGIVPTLLVFRAYPRLTDTDPLLLSVAKRAEAIRIITKEVQRLLASRQVQDALAIRNGLDIVITLNLLL
jgi:hypothetical protein